MEQENKGNLFNDLEVDNEARQHIRSIASWAIVVVVLAVIGYVINIFEVLAPKERTVSRMEGFSFGFSPSQSGLLGSVITIGIGLVINYFLYRFATQARAGLDGMNQQRLNSSFSNLKSYFMITSILMIIVFAFITVGFVAIATGNR